MLISVEVISDVICPWCFIGKRRLEKALRLLQPGTDTSVRWLPYQLNPGMPSDGISRKEYRIAKFGSWERSQELDANVAANGKDEGIDFRFDLIQRTPNTVNAHRLIGLAAQHGCQDAVVEAMFLAYFTHGKDLSSRNVLVDVSEQAGLSRKASEDLLASSEGLDEIERAGQLAQEVGVNGVPFFMINRRVALAGAQPPESFLLHFSKSHRHDVSDQRRPQNDRQSAISRGLVCV